MDNHVRELACALEEPPYVPWKGLLNRVSLLVTEYKELKARNLDMARELDGLRDKDEEQVLSSEPKEPDTHFQIRELQRMLKERDTQLEVLRSELEDRRAKNIELRAQCETLSDERNDLANRLWARANQQQSPTSEARYRMALEAIHAIAGGMPHSIAKRALENPQ